MANNVTHTVRKDPQISVRHLADYMAASEQSRRRILRDCKYRPTARIIQHNDARRIIADNLADSNKNPLDLCQEIVKLQSKITDTAFEEDVVKHNCDYINRFIKISNHLALPDIRFHRDSQTYYAILNGTKVAFRPDLHTSRVTIRNTVKSGALALRYSKGSELNPDVGIHQSAFMFGYLRQNPIIDGSDAEKALCITVDAYSGKTYAAPGKSVYLYKEMAAVCAAISERWPAIQPPKGAVLG